MKIEKLSDRQIRCILDKSDLAERHIKISELAYGNEKTKELFREMMHQASYEFGFDAEDIPLMIEAIPVSSECIVLIITKVDDPDELDTRFSKFTPDPDFEFEPLSDEEFDTIEQLPGYDDNPPSLNDDNKADDVINLFNKVKEYLNKNIVPLDSPRTVSSDISKEPVVAPAVSTIRLTRIYSFENIDIIIDAAHIIADSYDGDNILYKDSHSNRFYLIISNDDSNPSSFNRVCNILNEFGHREHSNYATEEFAAEHFDVIIASDALAKLSLL